MEVKSAVCVLWVNGRELSPEVIRRIQSLELNFSHKKASHGTLVLRDEYFSLFDSRLFRKGQAIHFLLGWINEARPAGPYIVKSYSISAPSSGSPMLTVQFQDLSHKMNKKQKKRRFIGRPTDILKKIAKEHGLGYHISSIEGLEFTDDFPLIQSSMTDAALIQKLADRYGYVWGIDGGTLYFHLPAERQNRRKLSPPVLSYRINDYSLQSFSPQVKYTSGKKRKGGKTKTENLDFLNGKKLGEMLTEALGSFLTDEEKKKLFAENPSDSKAALVIEKTIANGLEKTVGDFFEDKKEGAEAGKKVASLYHEAVDSAERLISWFADAGYQTTAEAAGGVKYVYDASKTANPNSSKIENEETGENEESEPGDPSGSATPSDEAEAKRRDLGKKAKAAEIITGEAIPTIGSMLYVPGAKITILGVGKFLSGEYMIKAVQHQYSASATTFSTKLSLSRSKFLPEMRVREQAISTESKVSSGYLTQLGIPDLAQRGGGGPIREIEAALDSYLEGGKLKSTKIDWEDEI